VIFKNFLNNKNIPYITIPLAIAVFVFLSIIILNFIGVTGLVSNLFFTYINKDISTGGRVAGQATNCQDADFIVDASQVTGEYNRFWGNFGSDFLLGEIIHYPEAVDFMNKIKAVNQEIPGSFRYYRAHNIFSDYCSADPDSQRVFKAGANVCEQWSGNNCAKWHGVYRENQSGVPIYDWSVLDEIYDTVLDAGMKPFVEFGFMPKDLAAPECQPGDWEKAMIGPPDDFNKWYDLVKTTVEHLEQRYGATEIETWYFEIWNEPNLHHFWPADICDDDCYCNDDRFCPFTPISGEDCDSSCNSCFYDSNDGCNLMPVDDYLKLYDYAVEAILDANGNLKVGGPAPAGPGGDEVTTQWMTHIKQGTNYANGSQGTETNFFSSHTYGNKPGPILDKFATFVDRIKNNGLYNINYPILLDETGPSTRDNSMYEGVFPASWYVKFLDDSFYYMDNAGAEYVPDEFVIWASIDHKYGGGKGLVGGHWDYVEKRPLFNVFQALGAIGSQRLGVSGAIFDQRPNVFATRHKNGNSIQAVLYQYSPPGTNYNPITKSVCIDNINLSGNYNVRHYIISYDHKNGDIYYEDYSSTGSEYLTTISNIEEKEVHVFVLGDVLGSEDISSPPSTDICNNNQDDDNDGWVDFPKDNGCDSITDDTEDSEGIQQCNDKQDNDNDGYIDKQDFGCANSEDNSESDGSPQCSDGLDNDSDGQIDFPADTDCASATDDSEAGSPPVACPYNTCVAGQTCSNWHNQSILCCVATCQDPPTPPIPPTPTDDPIARTCFDAAKGQCYPRRSFFHFGRTTPAEWYAKFDLVSNNSSGARGAKALNPTMYTINSGVDWNVEADKDDKSDDWNLKGIHGEDLVILGGGYDKPQSDITMFCPEVGNERYNEYVARETADLLGSEFDGVFNQGSWGKPLGSTANFNNSKDTTGIDMDRSCVTNGGTRNLNDCNDWYEHNEAWLRQTWQQGISFTIDSVRTAIGSQAIFINNTGGIKPNEFPYITNYFGQINGEFQENIQSISSFSYYKNAFDFWNSQGREPHVNIIGANPSRNRNNFQFMRFFLGLSIINEAYIEVGAESHHHYVHYYDEFDIDLGYPIGEAVQIRNNGQNGRGVWVRFFDNGVVIMNADETDAVIRDIDIDVANYNGPYYHFQGGQAPTRNNGQLFTDVTLKGVLDKVNGANRFYVGDAVVLTKNPTTMVTDIFIDDSDFNTSPGSDPAQLSAEWKFDVCGGDLNMPCSCDLTEKYWSQNCRSWQNLFGLSWNTSHTGTAVFTPAINVPGDYAIYEWHGKVKNQIMATNVSYTVNYAGGQNQTFTVNQEDNTGQWNKLGIFNLASGTGNNVTISASGANETVVADAIRFVYQGNHGNIKGPPGDYTPAYLSADFNCDNKIDIQDFGILLSHWHKLNNQVINYKHSNCQSARSIDLVIDKNNKVNIFDLSRLLSCWGMPDATKTTCWQEQIQ